MTKKPVPLSSHIRQPVSTDLMLKLVNLSGRQRMLSQRIVLQILLSAHDTQALALAKEALNLFSETHDLLVNGNHDYPGVFFEALQKVFFDEEKYDDHIRQFIQRCQLAITLCDQQSKLPESALNELGMAASQIVSALNHITVTYEKEAKRVEIIRLKQQENLMSSIQNIAKEAKIVSFNAQVIAARSGDAGREFAVVAGVMTNITTEIEQLVAAALNREQPRQHRR